jgi:hypothetical protein
MVEPSKRSAATASIARALARIQTMATDAAPNPDAPVSLQTSAGTLLPTASARRFIDALVDAGSPERVSERFANLKEPLRDALNWSNPKFSKATKAVARTVGAVLTGTDDNGVSTFNQGVEMVGYLSMISPLLEPDRLVRVAERAAVTKTSFGPTLFPLGPYGQLRLMLTNYSEPRREELLISLWDALHDGRWWDHTMEADTAGENPKHRRRNIGNEEREAIAAQVRTIMDRRGACSLELVTSAILARTLSYSAEAAAMMRRIPEPSAKTRKEFLAALATADMDHQVLATHIPFLKPGERPESPASSMIAMLLTSRGGPVVFNPAEMPRDPEEWKDLYPDASLAYFPYHPIFRQINGRPMPGLTGAEILIIRNANQLRRNADHMGNCTFGYLTRCETGNHVIGRTTYDGTDYNFALTSRNGQEWGLGEINSRYNHGNVPPAVRDSVGRLINGVNASIAALPHA